MSDLLYRDYCPTSAPFFGFLGAALAIGLACLGSGWGTARAGVGVISGAIHRPEMATKLLVPVICAGLIGIFGFLIGLFIILKMTAENFHIFNGYAYLAAGLAIGLPGIAAGFALGVIGDVGPRGVAREPKLYSSMTICAIFAELLSILGIVLGLMTVLKEDKRECIEWITKP